jgi:hypothetical protein
MVDWAADIHRENIERFYHGDPEVLDKAIVTWEKKKEKITVNTVVSAIANGDLEAFQEGLKRLRDEGSCIRSFASASLEKFPASHSSLLWLGSTLGKLLRSRRGLKAIN